MPRVKLFDEEEVLNKAMYLFWKQGYSATSVQDLVKNLGINRASLYDTYGGKEDLFLRAFEQYRLTSIRATTEFLEGQPQVKIGFRKLFEQAIQESCVDQDKKGCFVVNTATELIPGDEKIQEIIQGNNKKLETVFYEYLLKGEADGQFKQGKDLKATAALLFTFLNGLRVVTKAGSNEAELYNSVNLVLSVLD